MVGPSVAKILANHYKSYESWHSTMAQLSSDNKAPDKLISINGIGEKITDSLELFFSHNDNVKMVSNIASQLKIEPVIANTSNFIFSNKTVVFTETLLTMERKEAKAESLGAIVSSSVSLNTDYVVVGEKHGSKYKKAVELGVKILTEKEWLCLLASPSS